MLKQLIWILLGLMYPFVAFGQRDTLVTKIRGEAYVSEHITPAEAKQKAMDDARMKALRAAGVPEQVKSFKDVYLAKSDSIRTKQMFYNINIETGAKILNVDTLSEAYDNSGPILKAVAIINARIRLEEAKQADPNFTAQIVGINKRYFANEALRFKIKPSIDTYMNIFYLANNEAGHIYPFGEVEPQILLKSAKEYAIPQSIDLDYKLLIDTPKELHRLLIVLTKEKRQYFGENNGDEILQWIYDIPIEERRVYEYNFEILQKF